MFGFFKRRRQARAEARERAARMLAVVAEVRFAKTKLAAALGDPKLAARPLGELVVQAIRELKELREKADTDRALES